MSVFDCKAGPESPHINGMPAASAAAKPQKRAVARITWLVRMEILEEGTTTFAERQAQPTSSSSQRDQAEPRWAVQLPPSVDGAECSTVWGASGSELATAQKSRRVLKHGAALAAMQCRSLYAISFASSFTRHRSHRPLMHRLTFARRSMRQLQDFRSGWPRNPSSATCRKPIVAEIASCGHRSMLVRTIDRDCFRQP